MSGVSADGSISTNAAAEKASDTSTPATAGALSVWPQRTHSSTKPGVVSGRCCSSPQWGQPMASDGGEGASCNPDNTGKPGWRQPRTNS
jgi:hypothetical protein